DAITKKNVPLGLRFDFLAGTSTGGIIALGLATGRSAAELASLYENLIPTVFAPKESRNWMSCLNHPKYETKRLRAELENFFKDATLENVQTDVCITGVALRSGKPRFYKSSYQSVNLVRLKRSEERR